MGNLEGLGYAGTTVVVTGASSGMGEAAARILSDLGATVHAVDIQEPKVPCASFHATDLSQPDQVSATTVTLGGIGPIQSLFLCAGVPHTVGAMRCMLVNYIGTRQLADEVLPAMADGGGIAIIASDAGIGWQRHLVTCLDLLSIDDPAEAQRWCAAHPDFVREGYSSSKEMLIVWAMHRSVSLGRERGIRINCIGPCPTQTGFTTLVEPALGDGYFDRFPYPLLGRISTPEEQAWPLVLLNSPLNAIVTGTVLYTDQGFAGGMLTGSLDVSAFMRDA